MTRMWLVLTVALLAVPRVGAGQEVPGAERIEIISAIFGGGMMFVPSANATADWSRNYVLSAAVTTNVNRWIGFEGDFGVALGRRGAHQLYGVTSNQRTPNVLLYSGNIIYNPFASDRRIVPYVSGGLGGLTAFAAEEPSDYGLPTSRSYLTGSVGGGVRWFPIRHSGIRADYRFIGINNDAAPPGGRRIVRSAHRLYGALVLTF